MVSKYGADESNHPAIDPDVWMEAAGQNNRGRVRGLGKGLSISVGSSTSGVAGRSGSGGCSVNQSGQDEAIQQMVDQRIDARFDNLTQTLQSSLQTMMQQNFQMMMQMINTQRDPNTGPSQQNNDPEDDNTDGHY